MSSEPRGVAITGIGLLTPLGVGTEETWQGLNEPRSAVGPIETYDASSLQTQLGAEILELDAKQFVNRRSLRTMTRYDMLAAVAAAMAVKDSGWELGEDGDPEGRAALFTASGKEISKPEHFEEIAVTVRDAEGHVDMQQFGTVASSSVHPLFFIEGLQGASLFYISEAYGLKGPNTYFAGTAEAGLTAIARAAAAIRRGEADVAVAGGADAPVCWWNMAKIDSLGLTTRSNELGAGACRPFDRARDGTVMGEGGAFVVLEEEGAARRRDARIYARLTGSGAATDIDHLLTPDPQGRALAHAIGAALRTAGAGAQEIDYVAAHASGTRLGDASEAAALRAVFGERSSNSESIAATGVTAGTAPLVSSVKPATGHLGAGAGALNLAVAALTVHHGQVPPTLNLENPDPSANGIGLLSGEARAAPIRQALALARGLEGQNVALAVRGV
ncbi:MAG TPA: beta-ketoacyl-[acyl-carrier-protein] synthase family protein [Solirubrobacteraceae bacterium]|jgi:3-oxoacyl-[acyl-carrier-protein] synthase II|nr:beta-ketoacyl-[acyl-carrier-protein] synthase family protein [Solirubrobacteraceae bacterium]